MAMPAFATSRRDQSATGSNPELDPPRSHIPNRETTPRPSISPLSARASPVAVRDIAMPTKEHGEQIGAEGALAVNTDIGVDHEDDRSSSLSEPEDLEDMPGQQNGVLEVGLTRNYTSTHQSLDVDSEAETERLDQTPSKQRKDADNTGRTPSKLSQAAIADDDLSDPPSPILAMPDAASSTSTIETAGNKRKRSDTADSSLTSADSDVGESPRKRSNSTTPVAPTRRAVDADATIGALADAVVDDLDSVDVSTMKGGRGRKNAKAKSRLKKETAKEFDTDKPDESIHPEEEQSEESTTKSAEELRHKQAASLVFDNLAKQFTAFRERIYIERLVAVENELDMLNQPDCKHSEYLRQIACVDGRRSKQVKEIQAFYKFKSESIRRTALGERSQLHSQYFQHARELREDVMYKLGEDWYNIQKERRQSHQDKDDAYTFKFPTTKSDQIKQQAKYNQEVSVLSGVAKYVGFPAAPKISGAEGELLEDDLKAMKIPKRATQQNHVQPLFVPSRNGLIEGQKERLAHEQYLEQNAWARPQAPIHNHGTPNLTHTPDWAAEPSIHGHKHLIRNISVNMPRATSPYTTPVAQARAQGDPSSSGTVPVSSDLTDPLSNIVATQPAAGRLYQGQFAREQTSPLTLSKQKQNGTASYRNISGASTIDAPSDHAERDKDMAKDVQSVIAKESPDFRYASNVNQALRNGVENNSRHDALSSTSFRLPLGTFGTPTPPSAPGPVP